MKECCGNGKKKILFYSCSGGANVAEVADRACRELQSVGDGGMFCLAGVGAGIDSMVQTARDADLNVIIDGCDVDCGRKIFERAGLANFVHVRVTDLGVAKSKSVRASGDQVADAVAAARQAALRNIK